ncbi:hypothetical protein TNCV_3190031 [Trichonephila clavipes]|nr:hypothetical protein TNCV_3190031 [Trichonephila clavipes]
MRRSEAVLHRFLLAVTAKYTILIQRYNLGATCAETSTHFTVILKSLPKPGALWAIPSSSDTSSWVHPHSYG